MNKKLYNLMNWPEIEGIIYSDISHPRSLLGAHKVKGGILVQCFYPSATEAKLIIDARKIKMEQADEEGFFAALLPQSENLNYTIEYTFSNGDKYVTKDAYLYPGMIDDSKLKSFNEGINTKAYEFLGAHVASNNGVKGVNFAVWAPNALRVSVVGDFNNWDGRIHQMEKHDESGIFELFIPDIEPGAVYKYEIKIKGGILLYKSDPYASYAQLRPDNASVVYSDNYVWKDKKWIDKRQEDKLFNKPLSIYEIHLGSFKKPEDDGEFLNYREIAPYVIDYVRKQGYTHIELMPVMEHPLDESWGYQVTGYYAPTSRFGTPEDFKFFMDEMHNAGIGVILDWVPAHFPKDDFGLSYFDGTYLYEHADKRKGEHPDWGTLCYNYARNEVSNFLLSNAAFWVREYHADGIRMDAVASMLYLDYGRKNGEWIPNIYGGKENLESVKFLKTVTKAFEKEFPDVLLIAEESTAWPKVTGDAKYDDTLGFDYKWNMGWMNDFLYFMDCDPLFRKGRYNSLTFSMIYAYTENFILSISHDEVVHGKKSMINKMPGNTLFEKMCNLRAAYAFMYTHPGKKLLFMGQDFAMENEWWEGREIDWWLLKRDENEQLRKYVADLNKLYKNNPALYELDFTPEGFEWINNISADECMVTYVRKDSCGNMLLIVANFTPVVRRKHKVGVPAMGKYKEIFNSDDERYGGFGDINKRVIASKKDECDGREDSIRLTVPAMGVTILKYTT